MTYLFSTAGRRRIYDANQIAFTTPAKHPSRVLSRHDLFYITKGGFDIALGNEIICAKRDNVVVLPAGIFHRGISECEENTRTLWLLMEEEEGDGLFDGNDSGSTADSIPLPGLIDAFGHPEILKRFEKILMSHLNGDETRASAYTTLLLCDLYDACSAKESRTVLAEEIRRYINLNLNSAISNTGYAIPTAVMGDT